MFSFTHSLQLYSCISNIYPPPVVLFRAVTETAYQLNQLISLIMFREVSAVEFVLNVKFLLYFMHSNYKFVN